MNAPSKIRDLALFLLYLGFGVASAIVWMRIAALGSLGGWHADMIGSIAPAPNQYRPLAPWIAEAIRLVLPGDDLVTAYVVLRGVVTGITFYFFDRYLRTWFSPAVAAGGTFALAAVLPFTYLAVVQESDPINLLVFTLAFWAMVRGRELYLVPLLLIGTLNRESTAMLAAVYFLGNLGVRPLREVIARSALFTACWGLVYGGLRLFYGYRAYYCEVVMWDHNVASPGPTLQVLLLFGVIWILGIAGARSGPLLLRRALLLLPFYLALHYVIALVHEVRLFLPWAPVVIPLAWFALYPHEAVLHPEEERRA